MDFGQYEIQDGTKKIETMMDGPDMYIIFSNSIKFIFFKFTGIDAFSCHKSIWL